MKPTRSVNVRLPLPLRRLACQVAFLFFLLPSAAFAEGRVDADWLNTPLQVTSRTDGVLDMAVSADGRFIVYVSGDQKANRLWLASADPDAPSFPQTLADGPSTKSSPAISRNGRWVAYADTQADVKGDIYLIDRSEPDGEALRLTGRESEDGGPFFSPDNRFLFFHQSKTNTPRYLISIDLETKTRDPIAVETGGEAMFGSFSPDGAKLAFLSKRSDASGDLFVLRLEDGTIRQITEGPAIDMFPQWHADSETLYFSRIGVDTNRDQRLNLNDRSVIYRIRIDGETQTGFAVTPLDESAFKPYTGGGRLYFLSDRGGISNCWTLPVEGMIRTTDTAEAQLAVARAIAARVPYDPERTLLAFTRVVERFPQQPKTAAKAAYRIADLLTELNLLPAAVLAYQQVQTRYPDTFPESVLANIRQTGLELQIALTSLSLPSQTKAILEEKLAFLDRITARYGGIVPAQARIEGADMLIKAGQGLSPKPDALSRLEAVRKDPAANDAQKARALYLQAEIYQQAGGENQSIDTLRTLILTYPEERRWVDKAVEGILDRILTHYTAGDRNRKIRTLNELARENRKSLPALATGARNRVADLYYQAGEREQAKAVYQSVLKADPRITTQTAAARLALAELYYQEEAFRKAIDLYEEELGLRTATDRIYQLARRGYIRKQIAAGAYFYRLGEISSARSLFKALIDFDDRIVEAHRGYIQCAAATGDIENVLAQYETKRKQAETDDIWLYCSGLCLSYRTDVASLHAARERIEKAIRRNGSIEYYHQTLGYVYEVLETVYGESGQLERALDAYQKAYFLNDAATNPANAAHLELNLGNSYFLLGQYGKAFAFYTARDRRAAPFADPNSEILFYKRLGQCAFQSNETDSAVAAFQTAIERIDTHIDPLAATKAYDRLNRYLKERLLDPAARLTSTKASAEKVAERQSALNLQVAGLAAQSTAPPSAQWQHFQRAMLDLLDRQRSLNRQAAALAADYNRAVLKTPGGVPVENTAANLADLTHQVDKALAFPERLVHLKAETLDRLALAYQEQGNWETAAEVFAQVFAINEKTQQMTNLARNRRAVAHATYQMAKEATGGRRIRLLQRAAAEFGQVLVLLDRYGVPQQAEPQRQGVIDIALSASVDAASSTQAARGFSKLQERRLAETFLARIQLELGHLSLAKEKLEKQLQAYPSVETVKEKDRYGVSLLFHRAGLLEAATGELANAFDRFTASTELCLRLENPVSAALNLTNMAAVGQALLRNPDGAVLTAKKVDTLVGLDRRTMPLLVEKAAVTGIDLAMDTHNQLGVFYFLAANHGIGDTSLEASVHKVKWHQKAIGHFSRGLALFENQITSPRRDALALAARLHLNLSVACKALGADGQAATHAQTALALSHIGVFPDLAWRALAGLERFEEALEMLESVPLGRAGCDAMEITKGLAPLVASYLDEVDAASALQLVEKLSELERFQRTAKFVQPKNDREKAFFARLYPRLERIRTLTAALPAADDAKRPLLEKRLDNEKRLLARQLGPDDEHLPEPYRSVKDRRIRSEALFLISLGMRIDAAAEALAAARIELDQAVEPKDPVKKAVDRQERLYRELCDKYGRIAQQHFTAKSPSEPPDFISLLAAEPFDPMDLTDGIGPKEAVARIVFLGQQPDAYAVFLVTPSAIRVKKAPNLKVLKQKIDAEMQAVTPYIVYEDPRRLNYGLAYPYALNALHLKRCINNRKPFKAKLAVLPAMSLPETILDRYAVAESQTEDRHGPLPSADTLAGVNTLVLADGPLASASVPTAPGERSTPTLAVSVSPTARISLERLFSRTANLSLCVAQQVAAADDLSAAAHLMAVYGCPSTLWVDGVEHRLSWLADLLSAYQERSGIEALAASLKDPISAGGATPPDTPHASAQTETFLYIGHRGLSREEAASFAQGNFVGYVKAGRSAFDRGDVGTATTLFENAIAVASEVERFDRYRPDLLTYAQESAYRAGNLKDAVSFSEELVDLCANRYPGTKREATALLRLGLLYAKQQRYEKAVASIDQAVSILHGLAPSEDLVRALMDLGIVLENATRHDSALSRFETAAQLSRDLRLTELLAEQHLHIGRVYDLRLNQYAKAIVQYRKALDLFDSLGDVEKVVESKLNIGRCYRLLGNFPQAAQYFAQSLDGLAGESESQQRLTAQVFIELANNAWFQGRYEEAFAHQRKCARIAERNAFALLSVLSLNTEGLIWWSLGDYEKAIAVLHRALDQAEALANRSDEVATTLNNIGLVYRDRGDYESAHETFDRAIEIDTANRSDWGLAYGLRNKGLTWLKLGQYREASILFDRAHALSAAIGNRINAAKALLGKGDALLALKAYPQAESAYATALDLSTSMAIREVQWRAWYGLARVQHLHHGDMDAAEELLKQAIDLIEQLRSDIRVKQLKENFIANKLMVYEALVSLLADRGRAQEAFEIAERSRARNFVDLLGSGRLSFANAHQRAFYDEQQALLSEMETQEQLLAAADEDEREVYTNALKELRHEYDNRMIEMRLHDPQLASMVAVPPVDTDHLIDLMEPETALLSYYLLENEVFCWILKQADGGDDDRIRLQRISVNRNQLEENIQRYRRVIQNTEPYEKHALWLYETLVKPVEQHLDGVRTVGISPHGALHYLSFATLYDGESFLLDRLALFYVPSAGVLAYTLDRRTPRPYRSPRVLAIGNPTLADPALNLPFAEQEVGSIRWNFPDISILTKEQATERRVVETSPQFDIIHIASHGEFDPVNPLLSAIKLALPKEQSFTNPDFDGNLQAGEIFGLRIDADMVFLSACQTGLGTISAGDDVVGLNRSFFFAGTHTIVSSLWRVSDVSTAILIKTFYRLYQNRNKADCLQRAAQHVKSRYPHPGYWGAFTLVGDYY